MIDAATYKRTLGRFATGVVVVTARVADGPVGFTCQTFGALSLEPALVFFAATASGSSWQRLRAASHVGISVLGADQRAIASQFATSGINKFEGVALVEGVHGAPLVEGAIAHIEGTIASTSTHGDHDLCVVTVDELWAVDGEPLIFSQGSFRVLNEVTPSDYAR